MGFIYEVGDIVTLKKGHPCGSKEWEILRVGADFGLKCMAADIRSWCRVRWSKKTRETYKSRSEQKPYSFWLY